MGEVQESDEVSLAFAKLFRDFAILTNHFISTFDTFLFTEPEAFEAGIFQVGMMLSTVAAVLITLALVDSDSYNEIKLYESVGFERIKGQNSLYASY